MPSTTDRVCEFCGRPLKFSELKPFAKTSKPQEPLRIFQECDCPKAVAEREAREAAIEEEERKEARNRFYAKLGKAGIRKRYIEAKHPKAKEYAKQVEGGQSLYLTGSFGTGKTHLASAIARNLVYHGKRVRFVTSVDLLIELQSTYGKAEAEGDVLAKYSNCDVLILDDFGKEPPTEWALSRLYAIVNNRDADLLPIIVTSNYRISELTGRMSGCDESTAEALASRLAGMCEVVDDFGDVDRRLQ